MADFGERGAEVSGSNTIKRLNTLLISVVLGGLEVVVLAIDPSFAASNPTEDDGVLRAIKIRSTISFEEEVKTSAPCRNIYGMSKNPAQYERDTWPANLTDISRQVYFCFATRCVF
jgi:hypothetical protein